MKLHKIFLGHLLKQTLFLKQAITWTKTKAHGRKNFLCSHLFMEKMIKDTQYVKIRFRPKELSYVTLIGG